MSYFTEENWAGSRQGLDTVNVAYDLSWGALKGMIQRGTLTDDAEQVRQSLGEAIENAFTADADADDIAVEAIKALGFEPLVGRFGEIEAIRRT
jgi:hypothetical protein